ncbi:putative Ig domain-containing protein [Streptosporangium sp. NPDC051022]|uniref:DUF7927 domain-containing protein n=1 Tax=Streptosporangium sp. NPDC051022 TaxID=3155752 RepID=UPI00342AFC76
MVVASRMNGGPVARLLVLTLAASTLIGNTGTPTLTSASAAGTTLLSQPFHNNTADGTGSLVLPALPSNQSGSNTACLTASGNTSTGVLKSCSSSNDTVGSGKLRLTNTTTSKLGGVFGATSVPTAQGLDVTFNTYQYGGTGADGIAFVLAAVDPTNPLSPANIGQPGGALGYSAVGSSSYSGLAYGYLGIGLDVYGNFSNSTYQGTGCTNPAYISTTGTVPGQVVVRGPGQGLVGYCAINSTATSTSSSALSLRASTRKAVPVEVAINPTSVTVTTTSGLSVPAKSYMVSVAPLSGSAKTLQGSLPSVTSGLFPSSWLDSSGVPKQLAFGWVASTGGSTDFHEIDSATVTTLSTVPVLNVTQTSYNNATTLAAGAPVTYSVVASVGSAVSETSPISITETLPTGVVPVGAYGTGWVCAAPSGQSITCTNGNTPFAAGSSLSPVTVVGIVTGSGVTPTTISTSSVATASAGDANPGYSSSTTVGTLPTAPGGITLSSTTGSISGGNAVTVSGSNIGNATAIEIGTTAEQAAGTPVVLLPCATGVTTGCFTINANGTLTIPSMPSRASNAAVNVTVVTQGLAAAASYTYASSPATPAAPTATAGVTSATVTWTAPANNGSAITSYVVTPYLGGVAQTPITYDATATTRTLTGLTAGSSYTFTVAAVNAFGTGTAGPASNAVVPYNVPGKPVIGTVTVGDATATVTWTAPGNNGSAITGYVVTPYLGGVAQTPQTFSGTATTQTLTGLTPGATYTLTVAAQNAAGTGPASDPSASVVPNALPSLNFPAPAGGEVGVAYSVALAVTGGTSPYTWSISSGTLPAGLSLNASTGVLSGTPTASGTSSFTVKVTDAAGQSATQAVTLTIVPQPSFSFSAPAAGEVGVAYSVPLTVTGGTTPYTWSVSAGGLPAGLTLNASTGVLSGTPTASGTSSFTVKVTDALNQTATRTVTLTIVPQPSFSFSAPAAAQVGVAYSVPLTVTGGTTPYTWSVSAGSLPAGLTLNASTGVLSGTPTTTGGYPFTAQVVDANGQIATRSVTLTVTAGPLVIVKTADVSATAPGGTVNYTITVGNTGSSAFTGVTLTDPLTGVLDDAVYNADAAATSGAVSFTSPNLTWTGNVAAGATVTITYSVKVASPDTGNKVLANTVTSSTLGSTCPSGGADSRCTATVTVSGLSIVKTAGVSTTTPGSTATFTVTVTNNGQTAYTGATFTDALAGVLDDAVYNADATATTGSVSLSGSNLTWIGDLAVGATATVTYSVTVKDPDTGDRSLTGTISSTTQGNTCPAGNPGAQCTATITVLVPALTITTGADAATTTPGSTVHYTVTAANTGQTPYTGTSFTVPLAGIVDDAVYNGDAATSAGSVSLSGSTLTWTGNLAIGASTTVTFSATVRSPDPGDKVLAATVTSAAAGGNCKATSTAAACSTTVPVLIPALTITKTANTPTTTPGSTVRYTVTATNTGQTPYTGAVFTDALAGVLDDAVYNADATATTGSVSLSGSNLNWIGDLAVGATATVTYSVTVNNPDAGDKTMTSAVSSATTGSTCPTGGTNPACATTVTVLIPRLTITNVAGVSTTTPGGIVPYTITLTNTGQVDYTGATFTLAGDGVNDDAVYNGNLVAGSGSIGLNNLGQAVWTGDLPIGATVTVTGSVRVNDPDTGDRVLTTSVTSTTPGSTCPPAGPAPACNTLVTVLVPALTVTKTADTQTLTPGDTVHYTITAANTGQTPYTGILLTDALAGVLDDAVYNGDAAATGGAVAFSGSNLTWTGDLAVGATATVTYSVTVRDPDPGDRVMVDTVVSNVSGSTCPAGSTNGGCTTVVTVLVPALTVVKTADASTTTPGATVHYTVTVTNSGQTPYTGASFTDALAGVLDDAAYNGDATATGGAVTLSGSTLTWTGDLAPGATATVTYSVTVSAPDPGDALLTGAVVSAARGSTCPAGSTDVRCSVTVAVARLVLSQGYTASTAIPGSVIRLNATFTNTGQVPLTGIRILSATAGTVDDAIPNGDQAASSGTLVLDSSKITWTGNIPVGGVVTVTGTLTVKSPATGDRSVTGTLVSDAPGNNCPAGGGDPRCTALLTVLVPGLTITKTADSSVTVPGNTVGYTVTVTNSGQTPYTGATFADALAGVLDDAVYNGDAVASAGAVSLSGSTLTWTGDLAVGATATVTYSVTVRDPDPGDKSLVDTVTSTSTGNNCAAASGDPRCSVSVGVLTPALTIRKTAGSVTAVPGATVTYTITATNTGQTAYTGATFTDALADVLDDATYNGDAAASTGAVSVTGSALTWTGNLAVGASVTVTYSVTVNNPETGNLTLTGAVSSATRGSTCPAGSTDTRCTATVRVVEAATLTFATSASVNSAVQGERVTYTVTVTNSGLTPYVGATFTEALAGVLDDATYNGDAAASTGAVSLSGSNLTWTGTVPASGSATVTYSVTVNTPDTGDGILSGSLTSTSVGGNCPVGGTDPRCATTVTVSRLRIVNSADTASVKPGGVVRLTSVITNTGTTPYYGIAVAFAGADVGDDALGNGDQTATSGSLSVGATGVVWTGDVPVGGSVTVTGTVTVLNPDPGNRVLTLSSTSSAPGNNCPTGGTDPACVATVTVVIPQLTITKTADRVATVPGGTVNYTVTATNSGQTSYTGATVTDSLAGVLDDAAYAGNATATSGAVTYTNPALTWTGNLAVGASVTITYSVTVNDPDTGDKLLVDSVVSTAEGSTCPPASGNAACTAQTVVLTRALTIAKTANVASVTPGGTATYTVTVTNSGQVPYAAATFTDALAGVLDDAAYNGDATASSGTVTFAGTGLTWTGGLNPGGTATITYSVTADTPGTGDGRLTGVITSATPGSTCPAGGSDPRCTATVLLSRLTIAHFADVSTTTPGGVVNYTTTMTNTGQTDYKGAGFALVGEGTNDDATYEGNLVATSGNIGLNDLGQGVWTGDLAVGATVTLVGSVRVNDPDTGDKLLTISVISSTPGTNCPVGGTGSACSSLVTVLTPALTVAVAANTVTTTPGGTVGYTVTVTNTGQTPYTGATVTDDLTQVFNDAVYNGDATASGGTVSVTGSALTWTGDLAVGATVTIAYTVTVRDPDLGDKVMTNMVLSAVQGSTCPAGGGNPACTTVVTVLVPALSIAKAASTTTATPGGTVGYTITIQNTGQTVYTGANVTDALAGVLDDAVYNGDAAATGGTVAFDGANLTWTGDLAIGATATVTYTVTVRDPDPGDRSLTAAVTSGAQGSTCPVGGSNPACASTIAVLIPALAVSTVADRATATPGDTVRFTVTIANTGQTPYTGTSVTDSLAQVLDDATYGGNASADSGSVALTGSDLTWTGDLAVGATVTVTYTVTVRDPDPGDKTIRSVVTSAAPGSTCPAGNTSPLCAAAVTVLIPALTIAKSAGVSTTTPGGTVGHTITVTNTGQTPYTAATFTDLLAGALDDAVYGGDAVASTGTVAFDGANLTWTGDLAVGATATVTYSVTVKNPDTGDKAVSGTVVSATPGNTCPAGGGDPACATLVRVLVPQLTITKAADTGTVAAGGTVHYTVTLVNTGETPYSGATFTDPLAGVLDDAAYDGDAVATTGTVTYADGALTWVGDLALGATATVTYSVTASYPALGDRLLTGAVVSPSPGSTCPAGGTDPRCGVTVTLLVPALTVTLAADNSGNIVAGGRVQYTITAVNTGEVPYAAATVTDLLAGVLDDADYDGDATATSGGVSFAGSDLTWTGDLAVGATVVITFTVTVKDSAPGGDGLLDNRVTSAALGGTCPSGGTDPRCSVSTSVTAVSITLTDLSADFTLSGSPDTTVRRDEAVTMTVTTNSPDGYSVTVKARSPELTATLSGERFAIPIGNLRVREHGAAAFSPLSHSASVLVHGQSGPSAAGGDAISNDYEADIPFVPATTYSATLDYVATTN